MATRIVALLGTLDTKGEELRFVREVLSSKGLETLVIDVGVLGSPLFSPAATQNEVAAAAGTTLEELQAEHDRGKSIEVMATGAAAVVQRLHREDRIHGLLSLGGSAGTAIGTSAMRALPVGFPKLMVSTLASGDTRPYVGTKDIAMLHSVVDISGLNVLSRTILANAAAAIAGMVTHETLAAERQKPLLAATMFGVTTPCVTKARRLLEAEGYEVLVFHATGTGGQAMENLIADGFITGVLDITTTEMADELVGGVLSAGPDRLQAAGLKGLPQVVCPGAIDMVNFGPIDSVPEKFRSRKLYRHNPSVTLMRTTPEECRRLGRITAEKLNQARGPVAFVMPLGGVSAIDVPGGPFYWPEADAAYRDALKTVLSPRVQLVEIETDINDPRFARETARLLLELLRSKQEQDSKSR